MSSNRKICVVGLGYVGLPLAVLFGMNEKIIGFDINEKKIRELKANHDSMNEVSEEDLKQTDIDYTTDPEKIKEADFIIVSVPTPVDSTNKPDLTPIRKASETIGRHLTKGAIVVYESTVYPGVTEEVAAPILEKESGLRCGVDFKIGYSPERVNPGDKTHTIDKIVKVVSGMDEGSLNIIAETYATIVKAGVFKAKNIKTAEAAKVIENIQRDLNIGLMNELALIFQKIGISVYDVVEAAGTKWNFHKYYPGLVGGHCIGIDPYYLVHKAEELGYHPWMITAARRLNDNMHKNIAEMLIKGMIKAGKVIRDAKVLVLGLTFKEDVNDARNSRTKQLILELQDHGLNVVAVEPYLDFNLVKEEFKVDNFKFEEVGKVDAILLGTSHSQFKDITLDRIKQKLTDNGVLVDIKNFYSKEEAEKKGITYYGL